MIYHSPLGLVLYHHTMMRPQTHHDFEKIHNTWLSSSEMVISFAYNLALTQTTSSFNLSASSAFPRNSSFNFQSVLKLFDGTNMLIRFTFQRRNVRLVYYFTHRAHLPFSPAGRALVWGWRSWKRSMSRGWCLSQGIELTFWSLVFESWCVYS